MSDLKVMATKPGVYGGAYRKVGDVFLVEVAQFSARWMKEEDVAPVQAHNPEQEKAYRENATAALTDLGNAMAGNPSAAGDVAEMPEIEFAAYYEQVMGKKPRSNAKRETLIGDITERLNAD